MLVEAEPAEARPAEAPVLISWASRGQTIWPVTWGLAGGELNPDAVSKACGKCGELNPDAVSKACGKSGELNPDSIVVARTFVFSRELNPGAISEASHMKGGESNPKLISSTCSPYEDLDLVYSFGLGYFCAPLAS